MSAQRLSPRSIRRIQRSIEASGRNDLEVIRAWSHGGYVMNFVTADHQHGWWDKKTGEWELSRPNQGGRCYSTCPHDGTLIEVWAEEIRTGVR